MAVDQVRQKTHLQDKHGLKEAQYIIITRNWSEISSYQVNSFSVQVVFQCLLELPDHGFHKLAPKIVVPGIQEAN